MAVLKVMFSTPQWVNGKPTVQAEIDVAAVVLLGADNERLVSLSADQLVVLTAEDLPGTYVDAIRIQRPNAYRPWTEADEQALVQMVAEGVPISVRIERLGRRYGAIKSRMRQLGLKESWRTPDG